MWSRTTARSAVANSPVLTMTEEFFVTFEDEDDEDEADDQDGEG